MSVPIFFSAPSTLTSAPTFASGYRVRGLLNVQIEAFRDMFGSSPRLLVLGIQRFRELAREVLPPAQQIEADLNPQAVKMEYRGLEIMVDMKTPGRQDLY